MCQLPYLLLDGCMRQNNYLTFKLHRTGPALPAIISLKCFTLKECVYRFPLKITLQIIVEDSQYFHILIPWFNFFSCTEHPLHHLDILMIFQLFEKENSFSLFGLSLANDKPPCQQYGKMRSKRLVKLARQKWKSLHFFIFLSNQAENGCLFI